MTGGVRIAFAAWRDGARMVRAEPWMFGWSWLVLVVYGHLLSRPIREALDDASSTTIELLTIAAAEITAASVLSGIGIETCRFVTTGYRSYNSPSFRSPDDTRLRFIGWSLVLASLWAPAVSVPYLHARAVVAVPLVVICVVGAGLASCRLLLVPAAVAINAPDAGWRHAWRRSRGHVLTIGAALCVGALPIMTAQGVVEALAGNHHTLIPELTVVFLSPLLETITTVVVSAIGCRCLHQYRPTTPHAAG